MHFSFFFHGCKLWQFRFTICTLFAHAIAIIIMRWATFCCISCGWRALASFIIALSLSHFRHRPFTARSMPTCSVLGFLMLKEVCYLFNSTRDTFAHYSFHMWASAVANIGQNLPMLEKGVLWIPDAKSAKCQTNNELLWQSWEQRRRLKLDCMSCCN